MPTWKVTFLFAAALFVGCILWAALVNLPVEQGIERGYFQATGALMLRLAFRSGR